MIEKIHLIMELVGVIATACGILANLLPDGKVKTATSYIGMRLGKAREALK